MRGVMISLIVLGWMSIAGCAELIPQKPPGTENLSPHSPIPQKISDLAGLWSYEDKTGSYTITLNEEGKGAYDWEEGFFETVSLENGHWRGIWSQTGNDREGGFELRFSDDLPVARGKWWYTRIGNDDSPLQPGGHFIMTLSTPPSSPEN